MADRRNSSNNVDMDRLANWRRHVAKMIGLASLGFVLSAAALLSCLALALALKLLGVPPRSWFGSDYTDPRCAVVSGGMTLFVLGIVSFAVGRVLNKHFRLTGRLDAFWLSNPISTGVGLLLARRLVMNMVPPEFTAPVLFLILVAWPVCWHLSLTGFRRASSSKANALSGAYALTFLTVGLVRVYPRYLQ